MKVKNSVSQNLEYLCLSFNKWPSLQYKFWVSLVLWNHNNGEHCWLGNGPEGRSTLHKEGKSQKVITEGVAVYRVLYQSILNAKLTGRNWAGKGAQATGMTASLRILSSKADSNTWDSFTRSGLKLESVHQESPRLQEKGYQATSETETNVRSVLPGLRRKITGLLLSGPKSSFQIKVNLAFHLEIRAWSM